jgi:hypothetical protein
MLTTKAAIWACILWGLTGCAASQNAQSHNCVFGSWVHHGTPAMTLHRRIRHLEAAHADALNRCGTCGGPDPSNPGMVVTRHDQPLDKCPRMRPASG